MSKGYGVLVLLPPPYSGATFASPVGSIHLRGLFAAYAPLAVAAPQLVAAIVQFREHRLAPAPRGLERFLFAPVDAVAEVRDHDPMAPLHLHAPGVGAVAGNVYAVDVMVAGGRHNKRLPEERSPRCGLLLCVDGLAPILSR